MLGSPPGNIFKLCDRDGICRPNPFLSMRKGMALSCATLSGRTPSILVGTSISSGRLVCIVGKLKSRNCGGVGGLLCDGK